MKNRLQKIMYILLLCFVWSICFDTPLTVTMEAAPATAAQKAKAQREKEKAKKAKEREKAKAKAAKEREKAAKRKAKEKSDRSAVRSQTASLSDGRSQKSSYEEQVAEVEKWNAHVAEYMSRDISHAVDFWGQVGYSSLFTNTPYTPNQDGKNAQGYNTQAKGFVGGGLGVGYQLRYQRFLLQTGLELQLYASRNVLYSDDAKSPSISRSYATQSSSPEGMKSGTVNYRYDDMQDQLLAGYVQIPVLVGMPFYQNKLYFLVGPKVGIGVLGTSQLSTTASRTITDPELISALQDMSNHGLVQTTLESGTRKLQWGLNLAAAGEIGAYLTPKVRLGLFAEYGLMNIYQSSNVVADADELPVASPRVGESIDAGWSKGICSSLQTTTAMDARVHPFLIGAKATVLLDIPRKVLKPLSMPKEPMPVLLARVTNTETQQPIAGIGVSIQKMADGSITSKTTNRQGLISTQLPAGDYLLKASKQGYYADSVTCALKRGMKDTLHLRLTPIPAPIIYTYCARVYARDGGQPLEAEVRVGDAMDTKQLYSGTATDDGLFVTELLAGRYTTHLRYPGYMPLDDTVQFRQDTLIFYMTKIKEGIRVKINNLFFATNKTVILPESEAAMEDLATFLLDNPKVNIRITGHTDSIGSNTANQVLSEGRANSVRKDLIMRGVDAGRIVAEGKGETEPVDTNSTEQGRQNNRRVEFVITSTGDEDIQQIR